MGGLRRIGFVGMVGLLILAGQAHAEIRTLHILFVIDTEASKVGGDDEVMRGGMNANHRILDRIVGEVQNANLEKFKDRIKVNVLDGDEVSPEGIRNWFRTHSGAIDVNDGFWLYYCGHGAWDPEHGHYLATSGGSIYRTEIRGIINNLGVKSAILITDCCSSYAEFTPPDRRTPAKWKVFDQLFFHNEGFVDFTAASEGQFGWVSGTEGGFFTRSLVKYLCEPASSISRDGQDGGVNWADFFAQVHAETRQTFARAKAKANASDNIKDSDDQAPSYWRLGGWDTQYTRRMKLVNNTGRKLCVWLRFYDKSWGSGEWSWYPGNGRWMTYEIEPFQEISPTYNGFYVEAHTYSVWANAADGSGSTWGNKSRVLTACDKDGYQDSLGTQKHAFNK